MPKLLSAGQLIDRSWEHYRAYFFDLLSISAWLLLKAIVDIIALALYPTATVLATSAALTLTEQIGTVLLLLSSVVVAPLAGVWVLGSLGRLVSAQLRTGRGDVKVAMREGTKIFLPLIFVSILMVIVLGAALLIGFGPAVLLAFIATTMKNGFLLILSNLLLIAGIFLATILSFLWTVRFSMAPYALITDNVRGKAALFKSQTLVRGRFWSVLARYALPKIFFVVVSLVLLAFVSYVAGMVVSAAAGLNLDVQLRLVSITTAVFPTIVAALVNPLLIVADLILYRNLSEPTV